MRDERSEIRDQRSEIRDLFFFLVTSVLLRRERGKTDYTDTREEKRTRMRGETLICLVACGICKLCCLWS